MDYLVVFSVAFDDKVQKAIREAKQLGNITVDELVEKIQEVTRASSLTMIIDSKDKRITKEGRANFLFSGVGRDSIIYPINNDRSIGFADAVHGADVDSRYL